MPERSDITNAGTIPIPPGARSMRTNWVRAIRALRALIASPDDTHLAMELTLHIGARDFERSFQRFARSASGRALLARRPSLAETLSDRAALERMPGDSLAAAYLAYLDHNGFAPTALIGLQHETELRWRAESGEPPLDPLRRWFSDRFLLCHDLLHVLTDYGTDGVGEATLLAFGQGQQGGRANALLTFGAALEIWRTRGLPWLRYDLRAWRRGRRAAWLLEPAWEELLPRRLDTVRQLLGIEPVARVHPGGILHDPIGPDGAAAAA